MVVAVVLKKGSISSITVAQATTLVRMAIISAFPTPKIRRKGQGLVDEVCSKIKIRNDLCG